MGWDDLVPVSPYIYHALPLFVPSMGFAFVYVKTCITATHRHAGKYTHLYSDGIQPIECTPCFSIICDGSFSVPSGILRMYEKVLIQLDFIHAAQFLTKLPEDIQADELFRNIEAIHMNIDKRRFYQVLAVHKDLRES